MVGTIRSTYNVNNEQSPLNVGNPPASSFPPSKIVLQAGGRQATLQLQMNTGGGGTEFFLTGGVLVPGRWVHVAFAVDASGAAKLIVDRAEVASGIVQGAASHCRGWNESRCVYEYVC